MENIKILYIDSKVQSKPSSIELEKKLQQKFDNIAVTFTVVPEGFTALELIAFMNFNLVIIGYQSSILPSRLIQLIRVIEPNIKICLIKPNTWNDCDKIEDLIYVEHPLKVNDLYNVILNISKKSNQPSKKIPSQVSNSYLNWNYLYKKTFGNTNLNNNNNNKEIDSNINFNLRRKSHSFDIRFSHSNINSAPNFNDINSFTNFYPLSNSDKFINLTPNNSNHLVGSGILQNNNLPNNNILPSPNNLPGNSGHLSSNSGHLPNNSGLLSNNSGHLTNSSGHIIVNSGHLNNNSNHILNNSAHLVNNSGQLVNNSGHIVNHMPNNHLSNKSTHITMSSNIINSTSNQNNQGHISPTNSNNNIVYYTSMDDQYIIKGNANNVHAINQIPIPIKTINHQNNIPFSNNLNSISQSNSNLMQSNNSNNNISLPNSGTQNSIPNANSNILHHPNGITVPINLMQSFSNRTMGNIPMTLNNNNINLNSNNSSNLNQNIQPRSNNMNN